MQPGLVGTAELTVTAADTAAALGSGDVDVLGTPRVLALAEAATVAAVAAYLPPEQTTVGTRVTIDHRRPSYPGSTVTARATLTAVDGSRLEFDVEVRDGDTVVASGTVRRSLVDRSRFDPLR